MASVSATSPRESHGTLRRTECCSAIMPLVREVVERTRKNNPPSQDEIIAKRESYLEQLPQEKICKNCRNIFLLPYEVTDLPEKTTSGLMRTVSFLDLSEVLKN
ncbi:MAG: hypothetical protein KDK71_06730 [Chlamydiia bacterium]|nr:hypothetical protein [Chlamydiia bacterium]